MSTINTVIIEDEEKCVSVLEHLISEFASEFRVCGSAGHVDSAVHLIENIQPQIVFADIRIADGTGFDVLKKLTWHNFELIFVTAYDSYALEAIQYSAIHYLLKPIGVIEFEQAVGRLRKRLSEKVQRHTIELLLKKLTQLNEQGKKLTIPTSYGCEFVDPKNVLWCRSEGIYTTFYLSDKSKIKTSRNLGSFEDVLHTNNFFRIHNSTMINMHWICEYIKGKGGHVVLIDGTKLPVSQRRKIEFLEKFLG
jgi:two-component system LytT family response regulator